MPNGIFGASTFFVLLGLDQTGIMKQCRKKPYKNILWFKPVTVLSTPMNQAGSCQCDHGCMFQIMVCGIGCSIAGIFTVK